MNGSSDELRFYREWTRMDANNFQSGVKSWTGDQGKHEELCLDRINRIGQDLFLGMETFGLGKESCRILSTNPLALALHSLCCSKAPEGWRTPGRFATFVADSNRRKYPEAAALRRFCKLRWQVSVTLFFRNGSLIFHTFRHGHRNWHCRTFAALRLPC